MKEKLKAFKYVFYGLTILNLVLIVPIFTSQNLYINENNWRLYFIYYSISIICIDICLILSTKLFFSDYSKYWNQKPRSLLKKIRNRFFVVCILFIYLFLLALGTFSIYFLTIVKVETYDGICLVSNRKYNSTPSKVPTSSILILKEKNNIYVDSVVTRTADLISGSENSRISFVNCNSKVRVQYLVPTNIVISIERNL